MSNQNIMYCINCGNKIIVWTTSANVNSCYNCGCLSFSSQITNFGEGN